MEGSYGRSAFQKQGNNIQSPMTPDAYKTNVHRTKTRKWVEARTQNYDGDDWGADEYDDDDVQGSPPPPQQISSQASAPNTAVPSPATRPHLPPGVPSMSQGTRTPVGQSPLHIQTQQQQPSPTNVALPLSPETGSRWMAPQSKISREPTPTNMGPSGPIPPAASQAAATTSMYPTQPQSQTRVASQPAETPRPPVSQSQRAARFPGQGHKEPPTQTQPGPSNKPAGPRSWAEPPTSSSPARSPVTTTKPLPFTRPSEIYKRVEEEKEKHRQSLESSRPSMDSATGARSTDRPDAPVAKIEPDPASSAGQQNAVNLPGDTNRPGGPKFYPSKDRPASFRSGAAAVPGLPAGEDQDKEDDNEDIRRYSSSPKLPDLARMSTFGADFFSNSSSLTRDAPPLPSIRDIPEQPGKELRLGKEAESTPSKSVSLDKTPSPRSQGSGPRTEAAATSNALALAPTAPQGVSSVEGKSSSSVKPRRPSVPGAWLSEISEVSTVPEAAPTAEGAGTGGGVEPSSSRAAAAATATALPTPATTRAVSQVHDHNEEKIAPKGLMPDATQKPDQAPRATSPALPPLRTEAGSASTPADRKLDITITDRRDHSKPQTMPADSTPNSAVSEIKPTAPLVPRAGGTSPQGFVPSPSIQRISTTSTTHDSPVKESDKLRDEIIRTLSPVKPSEGFSEMTSREPGKSSEPVSRKSTYLDDVYDDYWGPEDTADPVKVDAPGVPKIPESVKASDILSDQPEPKIVARPQQPQAPVAPPVAIPALPESIHAAVLPLNPHSAQQSAAEPISASGHKRFSWEAITQQVPATTGPSLTTGEVPSEPEPKSLATVPSQKPSSPPPVTSAVQSPTTATGGHRSHGADKPPPVVEAKTGNISHSISLASTLTPGVSAALEPPSPLSAMSDQKSDMHTKPVVTEPRRLSIAEEKQALAPPTSPSSSPHLQHHPALTDSTGQAPVSSVSSPPPTATNRPAAANLNIMSFKQCMLPESASERIERLHETRNKFSKIDTGLDEWIQYMQLDPEHTNAMGSLRDDLVFQQMLNPGAPQGGQPGQQQHGPAGTLGMHGSQSGRLSGNAANFSHSTQQVGAKGKELLFTAGKLGKGLLSKGRSKLRQAGDKVNS